MEIERVKFKTDLDYHIYLNIKHNCEIINKSIDSGFLVYEDKELVTSRFICTNNSIYEKLSENTSCTIVGTSFDTESPDASISFSDDDIKDFERFLKFEIVNPTDIKRLIL